MNVGAGVACRTAGRGAAHDRDARDRSATAGPSELPAEDLAQLITALQSRGLRVEVPLGAAHRRRRPGRRRDALGSRASPTTVPDQRRLRRGLAVRAARRGRRRLGHLPGRRPAGRRPRSPRGPRYYDLTTADGIPYWQIALLHLDSVASTVLQTCAYWGNADQCAFCGIGVTLAAGRTIAKKTPGDAGRGGGRGPGPRRRGRRHADHGSTATPDRGALYVAPVRRRRSRRRPGCRCEVQFEPPARPRRDRPGRRHGHRLGRHPRRDLRPAGAGPGGPGQGPHGASRRTSRPGSGRSPRSARARCRPTSSSAWARTPKLTVEGCRRAIDMGVYPFVVPLRPVAGQPDGGPAARRRASTSRRSTARSCPTCAREGMSAPPASRPAAPAARRARACGAFEQRGRRHRVTDVRSLPLPSV